MNISIRLPLAVLESRVNELVAAQLGEAGKDENEKGVSFVDVKQLSPVKLKSEDKYLVSTLDVAVEARVRRGEPGLLDMLREVSGFENLSFEIAVSMYTQIEIGDDWEIKSSSFADYEWLRKPKLGFSVLKVNIAGIIQPFLENELEAVAADIDGLIGKEIDLKGIVQTAWEEMQHIQKIEESFPVWLTLEPEKAVVSLCMLQWKQKAMETQIMVPLEVKAQLTRQPNKPEILKEIPQNVDENQIASRSAFVLKTYTSYEALDHYLTGHLIHDQRGKVSFTLEDTQLSAEDTLLHGRFTFDGKIKHLFGQKKVKGLCLLGGALKIDESSLMVYWQIESCDFEKLGWIDRLMSRLYRKKNQTGTRIRYTISAKAPIS